VDLYLEHVLRFKDWRKGGWITPSIKSVVMRAQRVVYFSWANMCFGIIMRIMLVVVMSFFVVLESSFVVCCCVLGVVSISYCADKVELDTGGFGNTKRAVFCLIMFWVFVYGIG